MNTQLVEDGVQRYPMQSNCDFSPFSILVLSAHHSALHHEHPAH